MFKYSSVLVLLLIITLLFGVSNSRGQTFPCNTLGLTIALNNNPLILQSGGTRIDACSQSNYTFTLHSIQSGNLPFIGSVRIWDGEIGIGTPSPIFTDTIYNIGDLIYHAPSGSVNPGIWGVEFISIYDANGCSANLTDSSYRFTFMVFENEIQTVYDTICSNGSYSLNGQLITETGQYIDTLVGFNSCDSIVQLNLSVVPNPQITLQPTDTIEVLYGSHASISFVGYGIRNIQWQVYNNGNWNNVINNTTFTGVNSTQLTYYAPNISMSLTLRALVTGYDGCGDIFTSATVIQVIEPTRIPSITTLPISNITFNSAVSGGDIFSSGGLPVTSRGVAYGTIPGPSTSNLTTQNGIGAGTFTAILSNLQSSTPYFARAYATNSMGTAYGNQISFTTSNSPIPNVSSFGVVGFITAPSNVKGLLQIGLPTAGWGFNINSISAVGRLVFGFGNSGNQDTLACDTLLSNASDIQGNIAVLYRGGCEIGVKALAAQRAGAIGVIIINENSGVVNINGGGCGHNVNIPVVMISNSDGIRLRNSIMFDSTVAIIGRKRNSLDNDLGFTSSNIIRPSAWSIPYTFCSYPQQYQTSLGAVVHNYGKLAQNDIVVNLRIDFTSEQGQFYTIYNQNRTINILARDSSIKVLFDYFDPSPYGRGLYNLNFSVQSNQNDYFDIDNFNTQQFLVSNDTYSKVRLSPNGIPLSQGNFRPTGGTGQFEYGIFLDSKTSGETYLDAIKFSLTASNGSNLSNVNIIGRVYKWIDNNSNNLLDTSELNLLGLGIYFFANNSISSGLYEIPITSLFNSGTALVLDSGTFFISIEYSGNQMGISMPIGSFIDYSATTTNSQNLVSAYRTNGNWSSNHPNNSTIPIIIAKTSPVNLCTFFADYIADDTLTECSEFLQLVVNTILPKRWYNGQTNSVVTVTESGWYWVDIDSGGCRGRDSVFVDLLKFKLSTEDTTICAGSALSLQAIQSNGQALNEPHLVDQFVIDFSRPFSRTLFTQIGQKYLITISGIFALKCDFENQLDAAYQFNHPQRPQKSHPFVQWNNEPIRPTPNTFNSSHNYVYSDLYATQSFQNFIFSDSNYSDNCGQLTFSIFQYNPLLTFLWSNGDTTSGIVVTPETSSQYSCIVSNGITTCSASATIQTIPTQVSSFAIVSYGSTNFCTGDSIELLANFTQASYLQWQKDYANIQGENSQTLTVKSSGVYRLAAYDDTLDCPRYSNTIPIVVQPKLNAIIDTPLRNFLCFGDSILIRAINDDGARIQWRKNGVVIPGSNDSILKVFQGGSYDFIVSKQGFCGDTSRDVSIYFDYSNIVPVIYASSNEVCAGSPVILQANGGSRYIWENGDTSRSIILFPNYSETYSVQVFSPGGCMAEDSIFINVHQFSSIAEIQTDSSHSLCTGDSIRLIVNRLSGSGDFIWSNGSTSDTIYATAGGLYELRILEQGSICDGAIIDSIRIEELRDSIMYAGLSTICRGDSITLIATNFRNGAWSNGDNSSSITISPDTNAIISVAYYSVNNCPVFDTLEIIVIPPVQPDTPRNLLPANHSYDLVSPIQFTWYPVSFASIYDLYIWDSNSQRPLQPTISNTGINITFEDLLNPSTEYLWQLAARNSCYTTFSDTMRFTYRAFPDLIIDSLEVPLSQFSGSQFNVTYSVKNIGGASTGPIQWFDRIYLSTDLDLDKNEDVFLAAYNNLMYLDTNQSYTRSVSVQLPTQLLSSVYLFVVADNEDAYLCNLPNRNCPSTAERHTHNIHMPELREDNNHDYKLLNIVPSPLPDLKVQSIGTPIAVFSGDTIPIVCLIENLGESEVISGSQWRNCYFISPDNLFNPSNSTALEALPYVSQFMSGPLSVNTSLSRSHQIILPDSLFGNYYIYAQTDCDNNIFEGIGENNNLGRTESVINITLTPPPDLAVTTIIVPNQLTTPGSLPISYSVQNQGATSPRICLWTDSIWLSRDSILQPNTDIPLGALVYFGGNSQFLPGQSYHRSGNFFVPQGIEGSFYVIVCSDAKKEVFEHTYESNNIGHSNAISCTVAPFADLQIQNAIIPALDTLIADSIYTLQWEVKNHGQFYAAGGFYDQIVTIPSGNPNDTTIVLTGPIVHNDTIFPGDSKIMSATFTTPNISGFHDILIKTDVGNSVFEHTLENNNSFGGTADSTTKYFKSRPGSQGNPNLLTYYDFEVVSLISPAYGISGQNVQISYRVKNNGPLPNPGFWWNEEIHLSSDSNFSQYTVLGTSINAGVIRVGNFYNRTLTTQIPNGTFGPHFIRVFIDPTNRLIGDLVRSN
ncbi:MAG: hypothetical protein FJY17_02485, partial [Bacteroidetes bacterium]|nr:hypothetical protein [Bacteroidota bacterium]